MAFLITGDKPGLAGAFVRTDAHTAADALRFAREWAEQGVRGITIVNPQGQSYDIDGFGMVVSTMPTGPRARSAPRGRSVQRHARRQDRDRAPSSALRRTKPPPRSGARAAGSGCEDDA